MERDATELSRLLLELSRNVTATLDLQQVLDASLAALRRLVEFDGGSIQLVRDDALMIVAAEPAPPPEVFTFRLPLGSGLGGRVVDSGEPLYSADAATDERVDQAQREKAASETRSYFGAPLILHGDVIGLVQIDSTEPDRFPPPVQQLVLSFIPVIAAAVQNAQIHARELQTVAQLRDAQRIRTDLLALVSHELRTPLTSIVGFGEILWRQGWKIPAEEVADAGRRVVAAGRRLERLVDDLLVLSQAERGTLVVSIEACDPASLIAEIVSEHVAAGSHHVIARFEPDLPLVLADPIRLQQVVSGLIENARKFSERGSRIDVVAVRDGDAVVVVIGDRGRGIDLDELPSLFEPFVQAEPASTRSVGGLGIGLPIVKHLCSLMGATIHAESVAGVGSRFLVRVPLAPADLRVLHEDQPKRARV